MVYLYVCCLILLVNGVRSDTEDPNKLLNGYGTNIGGSVGGPIRTGGLASGLNMLSSLRPSSMIQALRPSLSMPSVHMQAGNNGANGNRPDNKGPIGNLLSQGYNYLNSLFSSWRPFSSRPSYVRPGRPMGYINQQQIPQAQGAQLYSQFPSVPSAGRVSNYVPGSSNTGIRANNGQIVGQHAPKQSHHGTQHGSSASIQN